MVSIIFKNSTKSFPENNSRPQRATNLSIAELKTYRIGTKSVSSLGNPVRFIGIHPSVRGNPLNLRRSGFAVVSTIRSVVSAVQKDSQVDSSVKIAVKGSEIEKVVVQIFENRFEGFLEFLGTTLASVGRKLLLGIVGHDPIGNRKLHGKVPVGHGLEIVLDRTTGIEIGIATLAVEHFVVTFSRDDRVSGWMIRPLHEYHHNVEFGAAGTDL
mmetsp:Transcript_12279/g.31011  ORF Transcript_12279/g.31011 Transcript_12279/m.31011 type:complete len:213 (-) Transcript_12279:442-1080(-)